MKSVLAAVLTSSIGLLAAGSALAAEPQGNWFTEGKVGRVQIAPCGNALCGIVLQRVGDRMRPTDTKVLVDMTAKGANNWKGKAFNPKDGKVYEAFMEMDGDSRLIVRGCLGAMMCQQQVWTRVN